MEIKTGIRTHLYLIYLFIAIFIFTGWTTQNSEQQPETTDQTGSNIIYYVKYASHSGIIIDRQRAAPYLTVLQNEFPDVRYLEFGWGDLKWYKTDKDKRHFGLMIRALFKSTSSGMFVWSLPKPPDQQYSQDKLKKIAISDAAFQKLIQQINDSFALDDENKIILEISNMYEGSEYRIYKARGRYHVFKNCNTWAEKIFKELNINIR
jgi:uncharacterized protein (TIGR02117 family)